MNTSRGLPRVPSRGFASLAIVLIVVLVIAAAGATYYGAVSVPSTLNQAPSGASTTPSAATSTVQTPAHLCGPGEAECGNASYPSATATNQNDCIYQHELIGIWQDTDDPTLTTEYRADGTFADKKGDIVGLFNSDAGGYTYIDNGATSTGRWKVVTDNAKERTDFAEKYPKLRQPYLPDNATLLRRDFDIAPWYFSIALQNGCRTLTEITPEAQADGRKGYTYRKITTPL